MKKRVVIVVDLDIGKDFDIKNDLAVVKYFEDKAGVENFLAKDKDFRVIDYILIGEVD